MSKKILSFVLVMCSMLLLAGCGKKEPMTAEEFTTRMEGAGLSVNPTVSGWEYDLNPVAPEWKDYVQTVTYGGKAPSCGVEFYVWTDEEKAKEWFEQKTDKLKEKDGVEITEEKNTAGYSELEVLSDGGIVFYIQTGNTTIYAGGWDNDTMEDVKNALK